MLAKKLVGEGPTVYDLEIISKDGRRVAVEVSTMLLYQGGQPVAVQGIARDITERRQLEEQLRQALKMEAIGRLAGGIAHDFNNILTVISGYSDLALRQINPGSDLSNKIKAVRKASQKATTLTQQLLAFSRKQILQPRVFNLNATITDIEMMLRRLIGEDIELITSLDQSLGQVKADPGQIEQLIMNLAINARDAMPAGGKLIIETGGVRLDEEYASRHTCVRPGDYVMLAFSDNGSGMDVSTQAHIFEPFFTTKEAGKGTGLGLSTVYGIVKQSGGHVWVYSEVGQGTSFKIYLPRVDLVVPKTDPHDDAVGLPPGRETILLVEDEEMIRAISREMLEMLGYRVLEAATGAAALSLSEEFRGEIDLLLTDVVMPGMSGSQLAERLVINRPSMKVLYTSGYTDEAIVQHGVLEEGTAFLQKPFSVESLARKVRSALNDKELF
jgi:signal transduction histidine kinase/CheY-like chemotaxis protein